MIIEFKNFEKKIKRKKYLNLDFINNENNHLAVIDDQNENYVLKCLQLKTKFKGQILINETDITSIRYYMPITVSDFNFYDDFTVIQNFISFLKMSKAVFNKKDIQRQLSIFKIDNNKKYKELADFEKEIVKIYFLTLISQNVILLDFKNTALSENSSKLIKEYLEQYLSNNDIIAIVFTKTINHFSNMCNNALIIADNEFSYFGSISELNIVKELTIIEISNFNENEVDISGDIDYKVIGNKIIVRKTDLEKIMYNLVASGYEIISVSDFNENTYLFDS